MHMRGWKKYRMPIFISHAGLGDHALVAFGDIVAEVLEALLARAERAGHAPDDDPGARVNLDDDAAVGDRAAARHAERPANQHLAWLDLHLPGQHRVVRQDDFARAGVFGKVLQVEIELAAQRVAPRRIRAPDGAYCVAARRRARANALGVAVDALEPVLPIANGCSA